MENDPLLLSLTAFALVIVPLMSYWLSKFKIKYVWVVPIVFLSIGLVMFFILVIMQYTTIGKLFFDVSLSLWTGGFFGIFYALYLYLKNKKRA